MTTAPEGSAEHFVANILPLHQGPSVKLRVQPSNKEYVISKGLLCAESPVFSKMFNSEFLESQQQMATLEETDDDVSVRSLEALIQWLYHRTVSFGIEDPEEHISAAIELARLADKYNIIGLETIMAQCIRNILKHNPHPGNTNVLAAASVEGFLRSKHHKFSEEVHAYPSFGVDLLLETRLVLYKVEESHRTATFEDPISGHKFELNSNVFEW
ncbi:unnamed protein product [Penicillium salamii]|nr:unnamed protein product [Penicillium salamii]